MSDAAPYNANGQLKKVWELYQRDLGGIGLSPTSTDVIEAWRRQRAQEDIVLAKFSRLQVGSKSVASRGFKLMGQTSAAAALGDPSDLEKLETPNLPLFLKTVA
ncbi:hypothetical protein LTR74_014989 [Friedmanniomyces endolithicus]|nr:hypothetical protein LTR74_014989 [Friedmanniomyces endolithicus]